MSDTSPTVCVLFATQKSTRHKFYRTYRELYHGEIHTGSLLQIKGDITVAVKAIREKKGGVIEYLVFEIETSFAASANKRYRNLRITGSKIERVIQGELDDVDKVSKNFRDPDYYLRNVAKIPKNDLDYSTSTAPSHRALGGEPNPEPRTRSSTLKKRALPAIDDTPRPKRSSLTPSPLQHPHAQQDDILPPNNVTGRGEDTHAMESEPLYVQDDIPESSGIRASNGDPQLRLALDCEIPGIFTAARNPDPVIIQQSGSEIRILKCDSEISSIVAEVKEGEFLISWCSPMSASTLSNAGLGSLEYFSTCDYLPLLKFSKSIPTTNFKISPNTEWTPLSVSYGAKKWSGYRVPLVTLMIENKKSW